MSAKAKRDATVVLYDLNMADKELRKKLICELYSRMQFASKYNIENHLFLLGTKETENEFCYEHISYGGRAKMYNINDLKLLDTFEDDTIHQYNWLEALMFAIKYLILRKKFAINLQIFFITDMGTPLEESKTNTQLFKDVNNLMRSEHIYLYVLGPFNCTPNRTIKNDIDLEEWWSKALFYSKDIMVEEQKKNIETLKKLVLNSNSFVGDDKIGLPLSFYYKNISGMKKGKEVLQICPGIDIACSLRRLILKKRDKFKVENIKKLKSCYKKYVNKNNQEIEYDKKDTINAIRVNKKVVPEPGSTFQRKESKSLRLLYFVHESAIPQEYYYNDESLLLMPEKMGFVKVLLNLMCERKTYAVVRRKYSQERFAPVFAILIPKIEPYPHFLYKKIPKADDIRRISKTNESDNELLDLSKHQHDDLMKNYLKAIDVDDKPQAMPLDISLTLNPIIRERTLKLCQFNDGHFSDKEIQKSTLEQLDEEESRAANKLFTALEGV